MDISSPLDKIESSCRFAFSLTKPAFFKGKHPFCEVFPLRKRGYRGPFSRIRCIILEQGLKPRPMLKPLKSDEIIIKKDVESHTEETHLENLSFSSGICERIEKLVSCKRYNDALELFEFLECQGGSDVKSDTYDALVNACIGLKSIRGVKRVFNHMRQSGVDFDLYMMNRVLLMHVKCGMMIDARQLFDDMPKRNSVSWNTIIGGLVNAGDYTDAFRLFLLMWEENSEVECRTLPLVIRASAGLELISPGQQLHSCALKMGMDNDVFVSCALIDMYSKCGKIELARCVFDTMPKKTTVGWNSIVAGYALCGYSERALSMYNEMRDSGLKADHFTYSIVLGVCARLASLEYARQAHAGLLRNSFGSDLVANTALVDFYSKWGRIEDARNVFERMPQKNVMSWNALIAGYGNHGRGAEAVELFEHMVREGITPTHVTFLAVLSACCYSGLYDQGWKLFHSMRRDYKIKPRPMHYNCMVELLGREGRLDDALALIRESQFKPTKNTWAALVTACRAHNNFLLGKYAAEKLYGMKPEKLCNYIVLLNIYNSSGKLKEAAEVLQTLRRKGLRILPACTWVTIRKQQHLFFTGKKSNHPHTKEICDKLDEVMLQISKHGYVPLGNNLLPDVDERDQSMLHHHSEKLAISYGLMSTANSTPLQLVQSHRICDDCHNAIKLISMVYRREIVFRDAGRFHRFKDGSCSCGDYW